MANPRMMTAPPGTMGAPKKGKAGIIILLVSITLILGFIALVAFNVFGLRDTLLYPLLRNVPLVGDMVPAPDAAETAGDAALIALAEMQVELETTAAENASLAAQLENLTGVVEQLERENERLAGHAEAYEEFQQYRETFYRNLALENPDAFMLFFETMHPALAEELFRTIASAQFDDEVWRNYLASWSAMHPIQVAAVIEDMLTTDMRLIVRVMLELNEPFRGTVLNHLAPESAGAVLRQMEP